MMAVKLKKVLINEEGGIAAAHSTDI